MIEIAYWAQATHFYQGAAEAIQRNTRIRVNDETIRQVANKVGSIVFNNDVNRAEAAIEKLKSCR